jgi:cytoskeleton protein RodZ
MMPGAVPSSQSTRPVLPAGIAQQPTATPSTQEQTAADIGRSLSPAPLGQGAFLPDASSPVQPGPDSAFTGPPPVVAKPAAIRALAKCWVQVKAADGEVLYDHIMAPDDSWEFPAGKGPFTMTAGNAGGVVLTVDNLRTKPLGGNGEVRRRIAVSEQAIRDGSIAALDTSVADPSASGAVISPAGEVVAAPDEEAPVVLPPPPVVRPRVVRPRVAPAAKEISADDLNARQLKSLGGGAP